MKTLPLFIAALGLAFTGILAPTVYSQGALTPPPGPPAPTMKTLDQIEPRTIVNAANTPGDATNTFIISAPGSYYFAGNITGEAGKHGISIRADDVTLDLNGFALVSGGGAGLRGVEAPSAQKNLTLRNGTVRGWAGGGARLETTRAVFAEKLRLSDNTGAIGLYVGLGALIKDCVANANETGIRTPDRCQVMNCISTENTGIGFEGGSFVTLLDCTASRNGTTGIVTQGAASLIRCSSTRNGESGPGGAFGLNCGISTGANSTVADCTINNNTSDGLRIGAGSTVRGCTVSGNGLGGIQVSEKCLVTGNACDGNGTSGVGSGITANGNFNRIDGNQSTANVARGFFLINGSTGNVLIRNTASGQGANNYDNLGTNAIGPIVNTAAGGTISSTSPWANFSY